MKINTSFNEFKKNHSKKKHQILFRTRTCREYYKVENLFKLLLAEKNSFIFESVEKGSIKGRYTIIGLNPDKIWDINKNTISLNSSGKITKIKADPLKFINKLIKDFDIKIPNQLPSMSSMLVGYFSYDIIRYVEKIPNNCKDDLNIPDVRLSRPKNLIIYDNLKKKIYYIENVYADTKIINYKNEYNSICKKFDLYEDFENIRLPDQFTYKANKNLIKSNTTKEKFMSLVKKAKTYIEKGDIFQVVLSQRFERVLNKKPIEIYNYLRKSNPSPFMFYFNYDDFNILGSSPEILVRLRKGEITIRPIAGTRPRGKNTKEDKKYELDLLKDKKELAEHLMLLDLGRNDVGKVSKINSVKVTEKFKVERYSHVMHIVSNVIGKFNNKFTLFETLLAGFPAGTVSGAPKIRAMEIIDELEKNKRKLYAGGIGYFTPNGEFDTCIALRTALIKNNKFYVQAGAGIVADSKPDKEYAETVNKAKGLMKATD
ncbi:anthranilate synthase component I [Pelagibacteraceae bacterium]|jgi:anthranilate synthase component 1|nr:anthranilate synthase component I [Pelagibacteraceae bacterium]|tara:strand:+ start:197 stop:1654 length:1458 start_codon:yes stop_codon:yes gene_type:complete